MPPTFRLHSAFDHDERECECHCMCEGSLSGGVFIFNLARYCKSINTIILNFVM